MENPTPYTRLLDTRQTAALLRHVYLGGPAVDLPPELGWDAMDERMRFVFMYRCAMRVGFAAWYRWYLKDPDVPAEDIAAAKDEIKKIYAADLENFAKRREPFLLYK